MEATEQHHDQDERTQMFARAVSLSATAFATIKAAIPGPEDAPPTVEQAKLARELCDTLSSATFDLLMAALNSTTALATIGNALDAEALNDEEDG